MDTAVDSPRRRHKRSISTSSATTAIATRTPPPGPPPSIPLPPLPALSGLRPTPSVESLQRTAAWRQMSARNASSPALSKTPRSTNHPYMWPSRNASQDQSVDPMMGLMRKAGASTFDPPFGIKGGLPSSDSLSSQRQARQRYRGPQGVSSSQESLATRMKTKAKALELPPNSPFTVKMELQRKESLRQLPSSGRSGAKGALPPSVGPEMVIRPDSALEPLRQSQLARARPPKVAPIQEAISTESAAPASTGDSSCSASAVENLTADSTTSSITTTLDELQSMLKTFSFEPLAPPWSGEAAGPSLLSSEGSSALGLSIDPPSSAMSRSFPTPPFRTMRTISDIQRRFIAASTGPSSSLAPVEDSTPLARDTALPSCEHCPSCRAIRSRPKKKAPEPAMYGPALMCEQPAFNRSRGAALGQALVRPFEAEKAHLRASPSPRRDPRPLPPSLSSYSRGLGMSNRTPLFDLSAPHRGRGSPTLAPKRLELERPRTADGATPSRSFFKMDSAANSPYDLARLELHRREASRDGDTSNRYSVFRTLDDRVPDSCLTLSFDLPSRNKPEELEATTTTTTEDISLATTMNSIDDALISIPTDDGRETTDSESKEQMQTSDDSAGEIMSESELSRDSNHLLGKWSGARVDKSSNTSVGGRTLSDPRDRPLPPLPPAPASPSPSSAPTWHSAEELQAQRPSSSRSRSNKGDRSAAARARRRIIDGADEALRQGPPKAELIDDFPPPSQGQRVTAPSRAASDGGIPLHGADPFAATPMRGPTPAVSEPMRPSMARPTAAKPSPAVVVAAPPIPTAALAPPPAKPAVAAKEEGKASTTGASSERRRRGSRPRPPRKSIDSARSSSSTTSRLRRGARGAMDAWVSELDGFEMYDAEAGPRPPRFDDWDTESSCSSEATGSDRTRWSLASSSVALGGSEMGQDDGASVVGSEVGSVASERSYGSPSTASVAATRRSVLSDADSVSLYSQPSPIRGTMTPRLPNMPSYDPLPPADTMDLDMIRSPRPPSTTGGTMATVHPSFSSQRFSSRPRSSRPRDLRLGSSNHVIGTAGLSPRVANAPTTPRASRPAGGDNLLSAPTNRPDRCHSLVSQAPSVPHSRYSYYYTSSSWGMSSSSSSASSSSSSSRSCASSPLPSQPTADRHGAADPRYGETYEEPPTPTQARVTDQSRQRSAGPKTPITPASSAPSLGQGPGPSSRSSPSTAKLAWPSVQSGR